FAAIHRSLHKLVAGADREVFVLVHDAAIGLAIVGAVITLLDERPGLFLFLLLGINELFDVTVPIAQRVHFGGAAGFAAGFHDVGDLIIDLQKRERAAGPSAAAEFFFAGAERRKIS